MLKSLKNMVNHQLKQEEPKVKAVMQDIEIEVVKHDVVLLELQLFIEFFPLSLPSRNGRVLNGYRLDDMYISEPKAPKRKTRSGRPAPLTITTTYYYVNESTGNQMELVESSKVYPDPSGYTYTVLRLRFHSDVQNTTTEEIMRISDIIYQEYRMRVMATRKVGTLPTHIIRNGIKIPRIHPYQHEVPTPWHLYCIEPCIDFKGSEDSIAWLHNSLVDNLWIKRYQRRTKYSKGTRTRIRRDGRELSPEFPTIYIADRIKCYRYTRERKTKHFLRFEFNLDKQWLRQKDIWLISEYDPTVAKEFFDNECCFFCIDLPKVFKLMSKQNKIQCLLPIMTNTPLSAMQILKKMKLTKSSTNLIRPKWKALQNKISNGMLHLNLENEELITTIQETGPALTKHQTIQKAMSELQQQGTRITNKRISEATGFSISTVKRHKKKDEYAVL